MTHFPVLVVIPKDKCTDKDMEIYLHNVMAPYDEATKDDRYLEKVIEYERRDAHQYRFDAIKDALKVDDDEEADRILRMTDDQYFEEKTDGYDKDGHGNAFYIENPNAKWDWWQTGGRYSNRLPNAEGVFGDIIQIKNLSRDKIIERTAKNREKYWDEAKGSDVSMRHLIYGIEKDMTREQYITKDLDFIATAYVDLDGKWNGQGRVGWWGYVDKEENNDTKWTKMVWDFISKQDGENYFVMLDCHI